MSNLPDLLTTIVREVDHQRYFRLGKSPLRFKVANKQVWVWRGDKGNKIITQRSVDEKGVAVLRFYRKEDVVYED